MLVLIIDSDNGNGKKAHKLERGRKAKIGKASLIQRVSNYGVPPRLYELSQKVCIHDFT